MEVTFTGGQPNVEMPAVEYALILFRDGHAELEAQNMIATPLEGYEPPRRIVAIRPGD